MDSLAGAGTAGVILWHNEEHPCPQYKSHHIVYTDQLHFTGTPRVQFLFVGHIYDPTLPMDITAPV